MKDFESLQTNLNELGRANQEIRSITVISDQGLLIAQYNSSSNVDSGEQNRLSAMILACQALTSKTLSSLSYDTCKVFTVQAERANIGMAFSEKYSIMVNTESNSNVKAVTLSLQEVIQKLFNEN